MPKIRRGRQRKDYRVADAAKKNPENETEEIVVTEDVEEMDDLDDDDMDNAEPPANATNDTASDSLTEDKIEAGIQNAGAVSRLLAAGMDGQVVLETVLHGFDLEILETQPVEYRCYCSRDRVTRTLISLGRKELQSIVDDGKDIHIDCQFCDKIYDYTPEQVRQILKELDE